MFARLLVAGLGFSLAGDVVLTFPGAFIPGLVAFLGAHLCYLALFKRGVSWMPRRAALLATLAAAFALYVFLFPASTRRCGSRSRSTPRHSRR